MARTPEAKTVFLCAAVAKLDVCEDNPEATARVNVTGLRQ